MKSEEQVGHRPESKHKTRVVCGANAARKVHPRMSSRHGCGPNKCTASQCSRGCLLPSAGQGTNSTFCRQSGLEVKIPCNQQREGQRRGHECQGLRWSRSTCVSGDHPPRPGVPCLREDSLRAQDQESAETRGTRGPVRHRFQPRVNSKREEPLVSGLSSTERGKDKKSHGPEPSRVGLCAVSQTAKNQSCLCGADGGGPRPHSFTRWV